MQDQALKDKAVRHGFTERSGLKYRPSEDETLSH
jgi:hypothetical protein